MPRSKRSRPGPHDIWRRHASEIRERYRNYTVKELKLFMEKERGFPVLEVSTWIEKLGQLGMRKNVCRNEWRKIFLHSRDRLEDPTRLPSDLKLKRTKKDTEIIFRGKKLSWDQAWRSMKNAKATAQLLPTEEPLSPLPADIVIRTPLATPPLSPSPLSILPLSLDREQASGIINTREIGLIPCDRVPTDQVRNDGSSGNMIAQMPFDHQGTAVIVSTAEQAEVIWNLCITGLPIEQVVAYTVGNTNFASPPGTSLQDFLPLRNPIFPPTNLPFEFEPPWKITHQFLSAVIAPPSNGLSAFTNQENYIRLFMVIYAVSNNLVHRSSHLELLKNLDSVFADVPGKYLETLLHSRLASIRAAFETFRDFAAKYDQRGAFQFLVKVGATYGWLASSRRDNEILTYAAAENLTSALRTLLDNGCRPDSFISNSYPSKNLTSNLYPTAIVKALSCGNLESAQLLLEHCDVNKYTKAASWTNFEVFLREIDGIGELSEIGLKLFLQAGADLRKIVDGPTPWCSWGISAMDYLFYFHRSLFHTIPSTLTRVQNGYLSRASFFLSLEDGVQSLETYLGSIVPQLDQQQLAEFLKRLIAEQFLSDQFTLTDFRHRKRVTNLETVHALVNFGFRFGAGMNEVVLYVPHILHQYALLVGDDCGACQIEAVLYLIENGATVTGKVLSWMARLPDTRPFDLALGTIKDLEGLDIAIAHAAAQHDFKTIDRLLHAGAKLDSDLWATKTGQRDRTSIIFSVIQNYYPMRGLSQMLNFLVVRGAPLRLSKKKPHLHHLLQSTLDLGRWESLGEGEIMDVVQYIVGAGCDLRNSPFPTAPLLEACRSTRVFEYLYRNGAQLRPGSPLATWIGMGGGIELCLEMLKAGAEPNAYFRDKASGAVTPLQAAARKCSVDIVELLLQAGSNVNAPAKGTEGYTALQASCGSQPDFLEGQKRKLRTIRLLLAHGADVNAAPARIQGKTALQEAAASGDVAVAKLLLFNRPRADVNAPPCARVYTGYRCEEPRLHTALDCAAGNGRIDMVKLLLNCNAVSHHRGKTGYEGAINEARDKGHLAVADLINQHAEDVKWSGASPDLSQPWRDHHEYDFEWGPDEDMEDSEDDEESNLPADDLTAEDRERDAVGCFCFHVHQEDHQAAAHDHEACNVIHSLASADFATVTAEENNKWQDQGGFNLAQDENVTNWQGQSSFQLVGFGESNDFDMGFVGGAGQDDIGQYTAPWIFGGIDIASRVGLPELDVHEVGEDDE